MADPITDPTAVGFSNTQVRTIADRFAQAYLACKEFQARWVALGGAAMFPNDPDATVDDKANADARPVIDGADGNNIANRVVEFVADYEANSSAKLNTVLAVAVNPTP